MAQAALKLPPVEGLAPPTDYVARITSGQSLEFTREALHRKIMETNAQTIEATLRMKLEVEAQKTPPPDADPLGTVIDELERRETVAKGLLAQHRETKAAIAKLLNVVATTSNLARFFGRGSLDEIEEEIQSYREVCVAYRDLRWAVIGLRALAADQTHGMPFSTYEGYLADR